MTRISRYARLAVLLSVGAFLAGVANAGTIVSRPTDPEGGITGLGGDIGRLLAVSWTQTAQSDNTEVSVFGIQSIDLGELNQPDLSVTFQLLDSLSSLNPIDTSTQTVALGQTADFQLWSGMSLGPGTYFITAQATGEGAWLDGLAQPGDPLFGGVINTDYTKLSGPTWSVSPDTMLAFGVTGDLHTPGGGGAETPEPATFALLGAGLTIMGAILRRRRSA